MTIKNLCDPKSNEYGWERIISADGNTYYLGVERGYRVVRYVFGRPVYRWTGWVVRAGNDRLDGKKLWSGEVTSRIPVKALLINAGVAPVAA